LRSGADTDKIWITDIENESLYEATMYDRVKVTVKTRRVTARCWVYVQTLQIAYTQKVA